MTIELLKYNVFSLASIGLNLVKDVTTSIV